MQRPDELAADAIIKENRETDEKQKRFLRNAGKTALSAAGTAALGVTGTLNASRILAFLNDLIPVDIAVKGISKISPKIGNILQKGVADGLDIKEGLKLLKDNLAPAQDDEQSKIDAAMQQSNQMQQKLDQFSKSSPSQVNMPPQNPKQSGIMDQLRQNTAPVDSRVQPQPQKNKNDIDAAILQALENLLKL